MKKNLLISSLILIAILTMALINLNEDQNKSSYARIVYAESGESIYIFYGEAKPKEEIEIKKGENRNDKIIDILNDLSDKGYELVSSNTNGFYSTRTDRSTIEFYYTLKKK